MKMAVTAMFMVVVAMFSCWRWCGWWCDSCCSVSHSTGSISDGANNDSSDSCSVHVFNSSADSYGGVLLVFCVSTVGVMMLLCSDDSINGVAGGVMLEVVILLY